MQNKKRFFAFGCSLTSYSWPTWADIIAHSFEQNGKEAYNFGVAGSGYLGVLYNIMKADEMYNFTDDDLIIIMWSSWNREDRIFNSTWSRWGNTLNSPVQENFLPVWSLEFDIIKCITTYRAVNRMFNIDYNASIFSSELDPSNIKPRDRLLFKFHWTKMPRTWNCDNTVTGGAWSESALEYDGHPCTPDHLKYVQDVLYPALPGLEIHPDTIAWVNSLGKMGDAALAPVIDKYADKLEDDETQQAIHQAMIDWASTVWKPGVEVLDNVEGKLWLRDHACLEDSVVDYFDDFINEIKK